MRVADSTAYRSLLDNLNSLNLQLQKATQEVSTGRRLNRPQDSPSDSAEVLQLNTQAGQIDQYRTNADSAGYFLHMTETSLDSVYNLFTSVFTRGSEAGNNFKDAGVRETLATEIRALRDEILSLANTEARGRYLFSGSQVSSPAFELSGDTAAYLGDERVNTIQIADGLQVGQNIPGSAAFSAVFSDIEQLLGAIESGDSGAIETALDGFSGTFAELQKVRTRLGVDLGKLVDSEVSLQVRETDIATRKAHIQDADLAEAITRLNRTRTALEAALSAGSLVGQRNLFDYLG